MSDEKQRAMMAAHCSDMAARFFRLGDWANAEMCASTASEIGLSARVGLVDYRATLQALGLTPEQIDAAVSAIQRGEWPATSLPGQVLRYKSKAEHEGDERLRRAEDDGRAARCDGEVHAYGAVLEMLGVKP